MVTVMLNLLEKYVLKRRLTWRADVSILLTFVFFACFQAWRDQYEKMLPASTPVQITNEVNVPPPTVIVPPSSGEHSEARLQVFYGKQLLNGMVIPVTTRHESTDGKLDLNSAEHFFLAQTSQITIKNVGNKTTGKIAIQVETPPKVWVDFGGDVYPNIIDPQQSAFVPTVMGSVDPPWKDGDVVRVKVNIFYGAKAPSVIVFGIKKKGVQD